MASKYAGVLDGLAPLPPELPAYQQKIEAIKTELRAASTMPPETLAQEYAKLRKGANVLAADGTLMLTDAQTGEAFITSTDIVIKALGKDGLTDLLSVVQERVTAIEQMLVESLDQDEPGWGTHGASPTTIKMASGASVAVQYEPTGKVEDKEAFRQWCLDNGMERSLQLWPSTMNSIVKERTLAGEPPPDGVGVFVRAKIVYRSAK